MTNGLVKISAAEAQHSTLHYYVYYSPFLLAYTTDPHNSDRCCHLNDKIAETGSPYNMIIPNVFITDININKSIYIICRV